MGVAVLSGVIASLESHDSFHTLPKWEAHGSGTVTPALVDDHTLPTRFIACVSRVESGRKLRSTFTTSGPMDKTVEVFVQQNVDAVNQSDVVILGYVLMPPDIC